ESPEREGPPSPQVLFFLPDHRQGGRVHASLRSRPRGTAKAWHDAIEATLDRRLTFGGSPSGSWVQRSSHLLAPCGHRLERSFGREATRGQRKDRRAYL